LQEYYFPKPNALRSIDLEDRALSCLIQFVGMDKLPLFQKLNKAWYCRIELLFDRLSGPMENNFRSTYSDFLQIERVRTEVTPTEFGHQKGIRIDRLLEISLLNNSQVTSNSGKTLHIGNAYSYQPLD
jgi:hypothetical protein